MGDTLGDYNSTMKAGLNFIHASYGFGQVPDATAVLKSITELPEVMKGLE